MTKSFRLEIDNAAFASPAEEIASILRDVARQIESEGLYDNAGQ
jgi:hypothetical protein